MLRLFVILVSSAVVFGNNSTTPKPTMQPPPPHGNFSLKEGGKYCILAQFAATFTINYTAKVDSASGVNITKNETLVVNLNRTTAVSITGDCEINKTKSSLVISWPQKTQHYQLVMDFHRMKNKENKTLWEVSKINFNVTVENNADFKNATVNQTYVLSTHNGTTDLPNGEVGGSYSCKDETDMAFKNNQIDFKVDSSFVDLKVEPFVEKKEGNDFGNTTKECIQDKTTPNPTTTTTPTPTTTPKPTTPAPQGNFSLEEDGKYCILAQFAATFTIKYMSSSGKNDTKEETAVIYLNKTTVVNVTGDCGIKKAKSSLVISWPTETLHYQLIMDFRRMVAATAKNNMTVWEVSKIMFTAILVNNTDFRNASVNQSSVLSTSSGPIDLPRGEVGGSILCNTNTDVKLHNNQSNFMVESSFMDLRLEPFVERNKTSDYGKTTECYRDNPTAKPSPTKKTGNNIVPIAVGCALAGLVLIVLIAYVIGRRKSHSGYEKV